MISLTLLGMEGDGHVGTVNLVVRADGGNDIGGIGPQFLRISVGGEIG